MEKKNKILWFITLLFFISFYKQLIWEPNNKEGFIQFSMLFSMIYSNLYSAFYSMLVYFVQTLPSMLMLFFTFVIMFFSYISFLILKSIILFIMDPDSISLDENE